MRLSGPAKAAIEEIKTLGGYATDQEAIRRAIADERFIQQKRGDGWTFLLRRGKEYRELIWPEE